MNSNTYDTFSQENRPGSNTVSTSHREPIESRKKRILAALRTINHTAVKIGKYGRYIAPVAA